VWKSLDRHLKLREPVSVRMHMEGNCVTDCVGCQLVLTGVGDAPEQICLLTREGRDGYRRKFASARLVGICSGKEGEYWTSRLSSFKYGSRSGEEELSPGCMELVLWSSMPGGCRRLCGSMIEPLSFADCK